MPVFWKVGFWAEAYPVFQKFSIFETWFQNLIFLENQAGAKDRIGTQGSSRTGEGIAADSRIRAVGTNLDLVDLWNSGLERSPWKMEGQKFFSSRGEEDLPF